nr:MAG TPA: hypothetical protein [Caudoviricetes sp.]DAY83675.1 MAG TPA: hypothetical protein [Caudoviricetes sp.]
MRHPKKKANDLNRNIPNSNIFQRAAMALPWSVTYTHNFSPKKLY